MKKIIILLFGLAMLVSCQNSSKTNIEKLDGKITYLKDFKTGLCFAVINSNNSYGNVTSITCVPCDSLKNVNVTVINR